MIKKRNISSVSFIGFVFSVMLCANSYAGNNPQRIGYSKIYPSTFEDWPNAFLSGNGKMGIMVFGNPLNETVILNDRKFFMAASNERKFNQVSASDLEAIRNFCVSENWSEANKLANQVHGWKNGGEGNKHPGFEMLITTPKDGEITNYSRTCNYRTGEISVKWSDNRGSWERKSFVSRKDNVVVQYIKAPGKGTISCSIQLTTDPGMNFPKGMVFTSLATTDYLNLRASYPKNTNNAGYEGVVRVETIGGTKTVDGNVLTIRNAKSVILLTRTEKYYSDCENQWNKKAIQAQLSTISTDYNKLLSGQIETHQAIYDRVKLDLNADITDRTMSNEELLAKQKSSATAVPALWERIFDAGRYHYLSSSSEIAPPDLLGIWTGDCNVGWSGYYHLDANLNLQVAGGNIGDMPEAMEGYFVLIERLKEGFEINASKLLGCRGMLACGNTAGINGLMASLNFYYPYQYVTGEMGWLLYPFWEHYQITGDKEFLRYRLYPLLREMGYFYEDFLKKTDNKGEYIFAGSISPESQPKGLGFSLVNNSTFDIACAKFCLSTLIETCKILGLEQGANGEAEKWTSILNKLPPYLVNSDGALQEWSWPGLKDNYGHRHSSHLISVWPLREITPETTGDLFKAAQIALSKKDEHNYENAGHGLLHGALNAANLNNQKSATDKLLRLFKEDFYYNSLSTSHYVKHGVFCTDVANTVPAVLMEMLVSSNSGTLELLPALTQSLNRGNISGLKARSRVTVEQLSWDMTKGIIECKLKSDIDQNITLIERSGIGRIVSRAKVSLSPVGSIARVVQLKAGKSTDFSIRIIQ